MVKPNVGTADAYLRLTAGLLSFGYGVSHVWRTRDRFGSILMFAGAMKIAEGVTRFCPMLYAFGLSTVKEKASAAQSETSANQISTFARDREPEEKMPAYS